VTSAASAASRPLATLLEEVVRLSRRFGADPEFTRGGGGNSSGKADGVVYIKPSGLSLAALSVDTLMPLRMEPLLELLADDAGALATPGTDEIMRVALRARLNGDDPRRPSVECLFHALLPDPIVLHTHPTLVNALTCARDGERIATGIFGDEVLWVPYVDPGLPLARRIAAERRGYEARTGSAAPRTILLQNHGLIVTGEGADDVTAGCERIVEAVRRRLQAAGPEQAGTTASAVTTEAAEARFPSAAAPVLSAALSEMPGNGVRRRFVLFDDSPAALEIASTTAGRDLVRGGPLTPDQIVYAGSWPLWLEPTEADDADALVAALRAALDAHVEATGATPSVVVAAGLGLFVAADTERFAATAREVILDAMQIAQGAARLGGVRVLAPDERRFIEDWEAEAYRRGVEAGASDGPAGPGSGDGGGSGR
jgi:rhamnose utilization protein RhaD (predicted bifunctional aldolase and dehydrogenase)